MRFRPRLFPPTLLLGSLLASPGAAQVNIERLRLGGEELRLSGSVVLGLTLESGNTEKERADGQARLDYRWPTRAAFGVVSGDFDWTGGQRVSNKGLIHLRYIEGTDRTLSPEIFGQINYDKARSLDFRGLAGAGVRIRIAEGERGRASLGLAYMFEHEELGLPPESTHPTTTSHHRSSSFVTLSYEPREGLALASTSYAQPRLDDPGDIRLLSQSRLSVQLLGPLTLDLTFDAHYDADPPDDIESLDTTLKTGIGIRF